MQNSILAGRYELRSVLGRGGMGVVYLAYDVQTEREVALKTIRQADEFALGMFEKERRVLARINHPNIVNLLDQGEYESDEGRKPFFVMPYLRGKTLDRLIAEPGNMQLGRLVEILTQTCRGLHAAHQEGLVHRDIKPGNIFVLQDDTAQIIDFGIVFAPGSNSVTMLKGTLQYMAPEQLEGQPASAASDIYALGIVAYEALTGKKPFHRGTEFETAKAIGEDWPPPVYELNPAVPESVAQVIHKAMAKRAANRFASAKEFGDALFRASLDHPVATVDRSRIAPRIERAQKAHAEGDYDLAAGILRELEADGCIDRGMLALRRDLDEALRRRTIEQLLEQARMRYEQQEYLLALSKLDEVLQLDAENGEASILKACIGELQAVAQGIKTGEPRIEVVRPGQPPPAEETVRYAAACGVASFQQVPTVRSLVPYQPQAAGLEMRVKARGFRRSDLWLPPAALALFLAVVASCISAWSGRGASPPPKRPQMHLVRIEIDGVRSGMVFADGPNPVLVRGSNLVSMVPADQGEYAFQITDGQHLVTSVKLRLTGEPEILEAGGAEPTAAIMESADGARIANLRGKWTVNVQSQAPRELAGGTVMSLSSGSDHEVLLKNGSQLFAFRPSHQAEARVCFLIGDGGPPFEVVRVEPIRAPQRPASPPIANHAVADKRIAPVRRFDPASLKLIAAKPENGVRQAIEPPLGDLPHDPLAPGAVNGPDIGGLGKIGAPMEPPPPPPPSVSVAARNTRDLLASPAEWIIDNGWWRHLTTGIGWLRMTSNFTAVFYKLRGTVELTVALNAADQVTYAAGQGFIMRKATTGGAHSQRLIPCRCTKFGFLQLKVVRTENLIRITDSEDRTVDEFPGSAETLRTAHLGIKNDVFVVFR